MRISIRKNKNLLIGGLFAIVLVMAVGYAAFATNLKISGTSSITNTWDIEITDITTSNIVGGATVKGTPSYEKLTATFATDLVSPGDSICFNIKVENKGTVNATLDKITKTDSSNPAILFATSGLTEGGTLQAGKSATLTVKVTYDSSVTSQPENLTNETKVTLDFAQSSSDKIVPIESLTPYDLIDNVVTSGDGLYVDTTESGRYTYRGANPNNYITLGSDMYRIIAVESDGTLKVIKNGIIGHKVFDPGYSTSISGVTSSSSVTGTRYTNVSTDYCYQNSGTESRYMGCNVWGSKTTMLDSSGKNVTTMPREVGKTEYNLPSTEAYLNTYLNNDWYNSLSSNVQSKIVTHLFNVGVTKDGETNLSNTITQEEAYKWKGKVGLMTVSDYVKASTNSACTSVSAYSHTPSCYNNSATHNWILAGPATNWVSWTISPPSRFDTFYELSISDISGEVGILGSNHTTGPYNVTPVLYLSSDVILTGEGTESSPYVVF